MFKMFIKNPDYVFKNSFQVILVGNKCDMEDERVSLKKKNDNDDAELFFLSF